MQQRECAEARLTRSPRRRRASSVDRRPAPSGPTSAGMRARAISTIARSPSAHLFVQIPKYARGRAPDVALTEPDRMEAQGEPVPVAVFAREVLRRHQKSERHLEGVLDLAGIQPKRKTGLHTRKHGHDAMAEWGQVNVEIANRVDKASGKRDFLPSLAQRGRGRGRVAGIEL